jgi:hypothetical protein
MTYSTKGFDVFVIFLKGKSWKTNELHQSRFWPKLSAASVLSVQLLYPFYYLIFALKESVWLAT